MAGNLFPFQISKIRPLKKFEIILVYIIIYYDRNSKSNNTIYPTYKLITTALHYAIASQSRTNEHSLHGGLKDAASEQRRFIKWMPPTSKQGFLSKTIRVSEKFRHLDNNLTKCPTKFGCLNQLDLDKIQIFQTK